MSAVRAGAIVGFGNVAVHGHLPVWQAQPDFRIVAIVDPDPQRQALAGQHLPAARQAAKLHDVLESEALDFIDIATPPAGHAEAILAAARRGVHVLCEKPLTTSPREYGAIAAAVSAAGTVVHTVHNWKYSEAFSTVQALLAGGAIGALRRLSFETERTGCAATIGDNWRLDPSVAGGGILVDHGWHLFYLLPALAGERPCAIRAVVERRRYVDAGVEDTAHCVIDLPSATADLNLTWAGTRRRTCWRFEGTAGTLTLDDDRLRLDTPRRHEERTLGTALSSGSHHPDWFAGVVASFRRELDDPAVRGANQAEAELCLLLLSLAYASSASGGRTLTVPGRAHELEEANGVAGHRTHLAADRG
jgi:predicted dehydrogenase